MSVTKANVDLLESGKDMQVHKATLAPGGKIDDHVHETSSSYVVVEGHGKVTGSHARTVGVGDVVLVEAGKPHGWANEGKEPFSFVAVFNVGLLKTNFHVGSH